MKRKRTGTKRIYPKRRFKRTFRKVAARRLQWAARKALYGLAETKNSVTATESVQLLQNNKFYQVATNIFRTEQGTGDNQLSSSNCRIGDKITFLGVKMKFIIEANPKYPHVYIRFALIRKPKNYSLTDGAECGAVGCFKSPSTNGCLLLDDFDKEKIKVLYTRTIKIKNDGVSVSTSGFGNAAITTSTQGTGLWYANNTGIMVGQGNTVVVNKWLSSKLLFGKRSHVLQYENGSSNVKSWDYELWMGAHTGNSSTLDDTANVIDVGELNQGYFKMYFKDM